MPATAGMGQDLRAADLVGNSPFLPPDAGQQQAQQGPAVSESDLEFRGMYSLGERYYFNVFNKRENKGKWLTLNDEIEGLSVTSFDLQQDRISIRLNGRDETLAMAKPSAGSLPVELAANSGNAANRRVLPANPGENQSNNPRVVRRTVPSRVVNRTVPPPPPAVLQRSGGAGGRPVPPPAVRTQGNAGSSSGFAYGPTTGSNSGVGGSSGSTKAPQAPSARPPTMESPGAPPDFVPEIPDFVRNGMVPPTPPPSAPPPGASP